MPIASDKELQDFFALWRKAVKQTPEVILPQAPSRLSVNVTDLVSLIHRLIHTQLCDIIMLTDDRKLNQQTLFKIKDRICCLFMELVSRGYISCGIEYQLINFRDHPFKPGTIVPDNLYTGMLLMGVILPFEFIQKIIRQENGCIKLTLPTSSTWLCGYEIPYAGRTIFYYPERCEFGILEQEK